MVIFVDFAHSKLTVVVTHYRYVEGRGKGIGRRGEKGREKKRKEGNMC